MACLTILRDDPPLSELLFPKQQSFWGACTCHSLLYFRLTEEQAVTELSGPIDVYVSKFKPMKYTISGRDERTLMKLIVHHESDRVVGAHLVGPDAAEIMQGLAIALKCAATKAQFDATVGIHPSAAEEFVTMRTRTRQVQGVGNAKL
eukprot:GHUV01035679.1.p2 GENE.GHUV01035679.1~~GHUV01035679.1.p2  ORF type:complete len:148 (+),score=39.12 GHUV01035679.1:262-705(+)